MKPNHPLFWLLTLAISGVLGFAYSTYLGMEAQIGDLQKKVTALELQSVRQTRMTVVTVAPKPQSNLRDQVYRSLQTINDVHTPLDTAKQKRVLLNQTVLTLKDPQAATEDAFFDLLGTLMDEDLLDQVQIPKTFHRSVRQELIRFGVPSEIITTSPQAEMVVLLKKPI